MGDTIERVNYGAAKLAVFCLFLAGFSLVSMYDLYAHGEHQWLADQRISDPVSGEMCCGPTDCEFIEEPKPVSGGYLIEETQEVISTIRVIPSQDGLWRRCQYLYGEKKGQTRCLIGNLPGF